eukprot:COSAG01_NODE_3563_length_5927_cov_6.552239_4_plen_220_part_00
MLSGHSVNTEKYIAFKKYCSVRGFVLPQFSFRYLEPLLVFFCGLYCVHLPVCPATLRHSVPPRCSSHRMLASIVPSAVSRRVFLCFPIDCPVHSPAWPFGLAQITPPPRRWHGLRGSAVTFAFAAAHRFRRLAFLAWRSTFWCFAFFCDGSSSSSSSSSSSPPCRRPLRIRTICGRASHPPLWHRPPCIRSYVRGAFLRAQHKQPRQPLSNFVHRLSRR